MVKCVIGAGLVALAVGACGQEVLLVGDAGARSIRVFDPATGQIATSFTHPDLVNPIDLAVRGDRLYVRDHLGSRVFTFRIGDGAFLGWVPHGQTFLHSIAVAANGDLLLGVGGGHVRRIRPDGSLVREYRQPTFVTGNKGVVETPSGDVLTANFGPHTLSRFSAAGAYLGASAPAQSVLTDAEGMQSAHGRAYVPLSGAGFVLVAQHAAGLSWSTTLDLSATFDHFLFDVAPSIAAGTVYACGQQFPPTLRNLIAEVDASTGSVRRLWEPAGLGTPRSMTVAAARAVELELALQDYVGDPAGIPVVVERSGPAGRSVVAEGRLDAQSRFRFHWIDGAPGFGQRLKVKARNWITTSFETPTVGAISRTVSLVNGDVDGDDAVTVFDYDRLSLAFDTAAGDAAYDESADLDGDGTVSVFDYDILSRNFDRTGD